MSHNTIQITR